MIVKMALYSLKSSGVAFRSKLADVLNKLDQRQLCIEPDIWMRIYQTFKLKGNEAEQPEMYFLLSPQAKQAQIDNDTKYWSLQSKKYVKKAASYVEESLKKENTWPPTNCPNPYLL